MGCFSFYISFEREFPDDEDLRNNYDLKMCHYYVSLLARLTPVLNSVIFRDMVLKGPAFYVCL